MRVLHWYPNYLGGGGVSNAVTGLANAQSRLGLSVALAAVERSGAPLYAPMSEVLSPKVQLICWRPRWKLKFGKMVLRGLRAKDRRALVAWEPDIIHVHGEFNPDNLRVPRLFNRPIVLCPHGAFHPQVLAKSKRLGKRLYIAWLATPLLYRKAVLHTLTPDPGSPITNMRFLRSYMATSGPSPQMEPFMQAPSRRPRATTDPVRFLYVGRLDIHTKGLDILLEALALVLRQPLKRGCHLTLVGPDWNHGRAQLEAQAQALGVVSEVDFAGMKTGKDLAAAYENSDVYIQCSRHEGQALGATDALLFGLPLIVTDTMSFCSHPEIARAWHVLRSPPRPEPIAKHMAKAIQDLEELQERADRELPNLRAHFTWDAVAHKHLEEYTRTISESAANSNTGS